jgi:hypothetical protein
LSFYRQGLGVLNLVPYGVFLIQIREAGFFMRIGSVRRVGEDFGNKI